MLTHEAVWAAIDALAALNQLSPSGLARKAGLDPTSFNKSKRITGAGRPRWPSTESIAKALRATETPLDSFMNLVSGSGAYNARQVSYRSASRRSVPVIGMAQAGVGGFFDDGGYPIGQGWDEISFPAADPGSVYALEITGDSMIPVYRDGDVIIVAPGARVRTGDRVVVKTFGGEVMAKVLTRRTNRLIELKSFNPDHEDRRFAPGEIEWIARVLWASQ